MNNNQLKLKLKLKLKFKQWIKKGALCLISVMLLSACELTPNNSQQPHYSNYYLWIKSLSTTEILDEIKQQERNNLNGYQSANINLILLYALPSSPIFNPYTAKSKLNKLSLPHVITDELSSEDFAFISLLKDQLNQQIIVLNKIVATKQKYQENIKDLNNQLDQNQQNISKLKQQITQLKNIELNIENN